MDFADDIKHLDVECLKCGHRVVLNGNEVASRLGKDLTINSVAKVFRRLRCRSCGERNVRIFDDAGEMLLDNSDITICGCGDAITLPRLKAIPETKVCIRCAVSVGGYYRGI